MRFPERTRVGSPGHHDAVRRLDAAREDERARSEVHRAAQGTEHERGAADAVGLAAEQVAAREAWVKWVERGY